jgi:hypothetical protein
MSTFKLETRERAALTRLFDLAEGYSGGSLRARTLLCAWWNGAELGGFDFADLWSLDDEVLDAALTVINLIGRLPVGTYADKWPEFANRMCALAIRRAAEVKVDQ